MKEELVSQLVEETCGERPLSVKHMPFGHNSVTYEAVTPKKAVMVRTNDKSDTFATTGHNLSILSSLGLPVATAIATDVTKARYPFAYMVLEKIPGRDLRYELPSMSREQVSRLAVQIVSYQRAVSALPKGTGFGWAPIGEKGRFGSWDALLQQETAISRSSIPDSLNECRQRVRKLVEKFNPYLSRIEPTCFLDDVTVKNVIVEGGELKGLVDFDQVCYGDPMFMISLTATGIIADLGFKELFYVGELCRAWGVSEEQRLIIKLYSCLHSIDFLSRESPEESDGWKGRLSQALERWLILLEEA